MSELARPSICARRSSPAQRPSSRGSRESAVIGGSKKDRYSESSNVIREMSCGTVNPKAFREVSTPSMMRWPAVMIAVGRLADVKCETSRPLRTPGLWDRARLWSSHLR